MVIKKTAEYTLSWIHGADYLFKTSSLISSASSFSSQINTRIISKDEAGDILDFLILNKRHQKNKSNNLLILLTKCCPCSQSLMEPLCHKSPLLSNY